MDERTTAILLTARGLLAQPGGWTQHRYRTARPWWAFWRAPVARCLSGALLTAADDSPEVRRTAILLVMDEVRYSTSVRTIVDFNDQPGRKKQEVIALLDRVIARG